MEVRYLIGFLSILILLAPFMVSSLPSGIGLTTGSPPNNSFVSMPYFFINISYSETSPDTCLFELYNSTKENYTMSASPSTPRYCFYNASGQSEGSWNYSVHINDTSGGITSSGPWYVTVDSSSPSDVINVSPTSSNGSIIDLDYTYANFTFTESHPFNCKVSVFNGSGSNFTMSAALNSTGGYCEYNLTDQLDGQMNLTVYVNDSAGNLGSSFLFEYTFRGNPPDIDIYVPANTTYNSTTVQINYSSYDPLGVSLTWYEFNHTNTTLSGNSSFVAFENVQNNITLWSNDSFDNIASQRIFFYTDTQAPSITLNSPATNFNTSSNPVTINLTPYDNIASILTCNLSLDGSYVNTTAFSNGSAGIFYHNMTETTHTWGVGCWDNANVVASGQRTLILDQTAPNYILFSPTNTTYANGTDINVSYYSNDTNLNRTYFNFGNWTNYTLSSNTTIDLTHGVTYLRFYATDSAGNINGTTVFFSVDTDTPITRSRTPLNGTTWTSSSAVNFTFNVTDLAIANCTIVIDPAADVTSNSISVDQNINISATLANGVYSWYVRCADRTGRTNVSETRYITVNYASSTVSSGSSSSSGDGETDTLIFQSRLSQSWEYITPQTPAEMIISHADIPVTRILIFTNGSMRSSELYVERLEERPTTIAAPSGTVYKYLNMSTTNVPDSNLSSVSFEFQIPKSWFTDNILDKSSVTLNRYSSGYWSKLPTTLVDQTTMYYLFNASSPGFSIFSISAERLASICEAGYVWCFNETMLHTCSQNELEWLETSCAYGCNNASLSCFLPLEGNCSGNTTMCLGSGLWRCVNDTWIFDTLCEAGCSKDRCNLNLEGRAGKMVYIGAVASLASIAIALIWKKKIEKKFKKKKNPIPDGYPYYASTPPK